jgi:hypothetical protein
MTKHFDFEKATTLLQLQEKGSQLDFQQNLILLRMKKGNYDSTFIDAFKLCHEVVREYRNDEAHFYENCFRKCYQEKKDFIEIEYFVNFDGPNSPDSEELIEILKKLPKDKLNLEGI